MRSLVRRGIEPGLALLTVRTIVWFAVVESALRARRLPAICRMLGLTFQEPGTAAGPTVAAVGPADLDARTRQVLRAVAWVSARWPWGGTCLRESLVAGRLLHRRTPTLVVGVRRGDDGGFVGHAWLEIAGRSLDSSSREYVVLAAR